jgi:hypothetical protein
MKNAHLTYSTPSAFAGAAGVRAGGIRPNRWLPRMAHRDASLPICRGIPR